MRIVLPVVLFFSVMLSLSFPLAQAQPNITDAAKSSSRLTVAYSIAGSPFNLEVPQTRDDYAQGLMYRDALPEDGGMIFPFGKAQPVAMWMKNCRIPLDMLFVRAGFIRHMEASVPPCESDPCPQYKSPEPVDTVIELPSGSIKRLNIQVGDTINRILSLSTVPRVKTHEISKP